MALSLLVLALPGALGGPAATGSGSMACKGDLEDFPYPSCHLSSEATLTLQGCDGASCAFSVETSALGLAGLPGWGEVVSTAFFEDGLGACVGPKPVSDALQEVSPDLKCHRACHQFGVDVSFRCEGRVSGRVAVEPGHCAGVDALTNFYYSLTQWAHVWQSWWVCNEGDGTGGVHLR